MRAAPPSEARFPCSTSLKPAPTTFTSPPCRVAGLSRRGGIISTHSIHALLVERDCAPLGEAFVVNSVLARHAAPRRGNAGRWLGRHHLVVVRAGGVTGAYIARRYDASGVPLGDEFLVNAITTGSVWLIGAAVDGGGFVISWGGLDADKAVCGQEPAMRLARHWLTSPSSTPTPIRGRKHVDHRRPQRRPFIVTWMTTNRTAAIGRLTRSSMRGRTSARVADYLTGTSGNDTINGLAGNDTIYGYRRQRFPQRQRRHRYDGRRHRQRQILRQ